MSIAHLANDNNGAGLPFALKRKPSQFDPPRKILPSQRSTSIDTWPYFPSLRSDNVSQNGITFMYLGSLECWAGRQQMEIRGTLQRNLLAALLAAESNFISVDVLITELWEKKPPSHSENALQAHVSRLRKKFREAGGGHQARLLTLPSGYQLRAADDDVDAIVFIRALNEVRSHSVAEPARVIARLRMALSLWRGPVFGGPLGGPLCRGVAARLEAARSFATETLFDLELQCGHHNEAIPELSKLVEEQSLNERLCELLMVALYRSGRQTEALQVYQRMRRRLDADLGVEPSPTLRKYEEAVLTHDPVLNAGADHAALRARASGRLSLAGRPQDPRMRNRYLGQLTPKDPTGPSRSPRYRPKAHETYRKFYFGLR